jgi:xeroderma pigmentosum group C-complementing protein
MLVEAGAIPARRGVDARPAKRKRPEDEQPEPLDDVAVSTAMDEDEEDIEFEDVPLPVPTVQTIMGDSDDYDDQDDADDIRFEDVMLEQQNEPPKSLDLNLTAQKAAMTPRRSVDRRKPASKEEKQRRLEIHKMHVLCLLSHLTLRNRWCNDPEVGDALKVMLTDKMIKYLNPGTNLSQFGRTESLKNGLQQVSNMFRVNFTVSERGLRRALWADDEKQLQDVDTLSALLHYTFDHD